MADSNMTIGAELGETTSGRLSRLRKVVFSETAAGAGNATTTFAITGRLLRYITTGGDADWEFILNDGTANIITISSLTATAASGALNMHATVPHNGIPLVDQTLKCTTTNTSGTVATVTIIWEESGIL